MLDDLDDPLDHLADRNRPGAHSANRKTLAIGSDIEIAGRVGEDLHRAYGDIVHAEGHFWRYSGTHWTTIPEHELRLAVHAYDGADFKTPTGEPSRVKLSRGRVDSVLNELAAAVAKPLFFETVTVGINCASGFIRFSADGMPDLESHGPDHRCRHTLPGRWSLEVTGTPPEGSLLSRLLDGVFHGDADATAKVDLLAEIVGGAALGCATKLRQPRAVILKGETAENGKSQILDLARGLLPSSAICSVTTGRMGDERHIIGLVGKLLNASDELSSAGAIASDTFKAVVTGEPVQGRDVYKSRVEFRPVAQHLLATNTLPAFAGGMDRGVQRRLLVIPFNRVIPTEERVEGIGRRIAKEEADLLLSWAVDGARRLIRHREFSIPTSCKAALADWLYGADPVLAWLDDRVEVRPIIDDGPKVRTSYAHEQFLSWAQAEGFKRDTLPAINGFVQRIKANASGIEHRRNSEGRFFLGMVIRHFTPPSSW
jgi:putative DNA primase/helicase